MTEQAVAPSTPTAGKASLYLDSNSVLLAVLDNASTQDASGPLLLADQHTSSGTAINVTGVPTWVKRITVNNVGLSVSGTSYPMYRLGDSGGVETNVYQGSVAMLTAGSVSTFTVSSGFMLYTIGSAGNIMHGQTIFILQSVSSNTWTCCSQLSNSAGAAVSFVSGSKALSAPLDRIQLTTHSGTDTFDGGVMSVVYE